MSDFPIFAAEWPLLLRNLREQHFSGVLPPALLGLLQRLEEFGFQQRVPLPSEQTETSGFHFQLALEAGNSETQDLQCTADTDLRNSGTQLTSMPTFTPTFTPTLMQTLTPTFLPSLAVTTWGAEWGNGTQECAKPSLLFSSMNVDAMDVDSGSFDNNFDVLMMTGDVEPGTPSATLLGSLSPRSSPPFSPTLTPELAVMRLSPLTLAPSSPWRQLEKLDDSSAHLGVDVDLPTDASLGGDLVSGKRRLRKRPTGKGDPRGGGEGNGDPAHRQCHRGGQAVRARRHAVYIGPERLGGENDVQLVDLDDNLGEGNPGEGVEVDYGGPVPEVLPFSGEAVPVISALASAARDFIYRSAGLEAQSLAGLITNVPAVMKALIHGQSTLEAQGTLDSGSSDLQVLMRVVERCRSLEIRDACLQLTYLVNALMLAAQMNRTMRATQKPKYTIFTELRVYVERCHPEIPDASTIFSRRTLDRYFMDGMSIAALCGAGSFYILILLACSRARTEIRKIDGTMINRLAKLIRCPTDTPEGRLVKGDVIPAIAHMRQLYPLLLKVILPSTTLDELFPEESDKLAIQEVEWGNIQLTDHIMDQILYYDFVKERDWESWSPTTVPVQKGKNWTIDSLDQILPEPYFPALLYHRDAICLPKWNLIPDRPELITINTPFRPDLKVNSSEPYGEGDQERFDFTERHREFAGKAQEATDILDFEDKLKKQLAKGKKYRPNKYLLLDTKMIDGKMLRINDAYKNLLALIIANMPPHLRKRLLDTIDLAYRERVKHCDTKAANGKHVFGSIHFSYYNRYSKRGDGVPGDTDPAGLHFPGKKKISTAQFVPRASKEMQEHSSEYEILHDGLEPIFKWIETVMEQLLPENVAELKIALEVLPCSHTSPVYPFSGYVVNLNVSTRAHRDLQDKKICLIIVISSEDCLGGELCLVEPGLVLRLRNGDAIVFASATLTHFNTHYIGRRVSLVFQTDKHLDSWVKDRNGWDQIIRVITTNGKT